jgi:succinoglycan biosynthesis transport protein ExoP
MDSRDIIRPTEIVLNAGRATSLHGPARQLVRPSDSGASINLLASLRGILRWWWQALIVWAVLSVAVCVAIQYVVKPTYEASSLIRIEPTAQALFESSTPSSNFQNYLETQIQLITSPNVLLAAASDSQASGMDGIRSSPEPEVVLRRMLVVKLLPKSFLIEVSTTSPSPAEAAGVVNSVVDAFLKSDGDWSDGMTRSQIKNLEIYNRGLQEQVDAKQKAWLDLAAKGNVTPRSLTPDREEGANSVSLDRYQQLQQKLMETELALVEAQAIMEASRGDSPDMSPELLERRITGAVHEDPEVARLAGQIETLSGRVERMRAMVRDSHDPSIVHIQSQLTDLKARYRESWDSKSEALRERLSQRREEDKGPAAKVASLQKSKALMESRLAGMVVSNREQSTDAVKSSLVQADLNRLVNMQEAVNRRLEQLRFESRGQARIRRVSEARPPSKPSSDKRLRLMAMAPIGVFALILGLTTLQELRAGRLGGMSDLARRMTVEVFAVPPLPTSRPARMLAKSRTQEELIEDFAHRIDHIREALCGHLIAGGPGRCVVITSAVSGEGKTTLASQLAVRCANAGASTLLIDADVRRASLGELFGVPAGPGLTDILKGDVELSDAVVRLGPIGGCDLLPAGFPEPNPARLLLGRQLIPLLELVRTRYDVIIIDTPPVLPVTDALTIGRWADGVVLATRLDTSRVRLVEQASGLFLAAGIPILGAVVHGVVASPMATVDYYSASHRNGRTNRSVNS